MQVLRPATAEEALTLYSAHPNAVPLAGGTDFMVSWNWGDANGKTVLDLSRLANWRRIRESAKGLRVGALVTHWELQQHRRTLSRLPLLVLASATVGGRAIQTRGTLGGNIANASPAGDTFPPLAVYQARVRLASIAGKRTLDFLDVFAGVKRTNLAPGELIESIEIDFPPRPARQLFRKVGTRAASAISKTVAAGLLWLRPDGRIRELRFALGSMAETVKRLHAVEAFVRNEKPSAKLASRAASLLEEDVSPIDDLRSTRDYRLRVSRNLLHAFLLR